MFEIPKAVSDLLNEGTLLQTSLKPRSRIEFVMRSGKTILVETIFLSEDFIRTFQEIKSSFVMPNGDQSYTYIDKRDVVCYTITKI